MKSKLLALLLSLALCAALTPAALAVDVPTDVIDAKDELATVDITQVYNGRETDNGVHNYATDGDEVDITYEAALRMTEEMAIYLNVRQAQLMDAKFNVHVQIDAGLLEFTEAGDALTVTFSSSFLKPWDVDADDIRKYPDAFSDYKAGAYTSEFKGRAQDKDGTYIYTYTISVDKAWAQRYAEQHGFIDVPMELIVYYDGAAAYGCEDLPAAASGAQAIFYNFTVDDWRKEITVALAGLRVKDSVAPTVTYDSSTWKWVEAQGTIDGEFTYISDAHGYTINTIGDYARAVENSPGDIRTLEFGNDFATDDDQIIEEWTSNLVRVLLKREGASQPSVPVVPDSPYLDLDDHFAYIIGMPDGLVHPEGEITRAEVATIFFRMLTDETRSQYWCKTNPYPDVDADDWFNNAVSTLTNLGIFTGLPDGTFGAYNSITRAEFATVAVRFFTVTGESYTWTEDAFSDIAGHWANEYINLAYLLDIVNGYPDGTFLPQNAITRAEAMTIVNNTLRRAPCSEGIKPVEEYMITWPDNMDTAKWYYAAVQEATNSHEYTWFTDTKDEELLNKELWQEILPVRDWAAFENAWSTANSAANPGEVTGGN